MAWGGRITRHILAFQAVATVLAAIAAYLLAAGVGAASAAAGGFTAMAGMMFLSRGVFAAVPGSTSQTMLRAFYRAAAGKIVLTVVLFTAAIAWLELPLLPLLGGYAAALAAYWLSLPFLIEETTGK